MTPETHAALARVGAILRGAGLTPRALAAWAGTARISALPARLANVAAPTTPAAALLAAFAAGEAVALGALARLPLRGADTWPQIVEGLVDAGVVTRDGDHVRACVAVVPLGHALLVCDRLDAPIEGDLVCWPDDSSHHLAAAIPPGRRARWLDLGCGSAFAPLARPELAAQIAGIDINARAVHHAQLGAALSGLAQLTVSVGDIGADHDAADLVTCNAPIPDPPGAERFPSAAIVEVWRRADAAFFDRLWPALRRAVRRDGLVVVHGASDAVLPALEGAEGERVVVTYTPASVRGFAVAWWRPDAPDRFVATRRALTPERPHLEARDREDALAA